MLLVVLCNFSVPFGKLFPKIISNSFGSKTLDNGSIGITAPYGYPQRNRGSSMTVAVKENSKFCLFVRREIDNYRLDPDKFRIHPQITRRAGNGEAWESTTNMASAFPMALSRARKTLRLPNLAEITQ